MVSGASGSAGVQQSQGRDPHPGEKEFVVCPTLGSLSIFCCVVVVVVVVVLSVLQPLVVNRVVQAWQADAMMAAAGGSPGGTGALHPQLMMGRMEFAPRQGLASSKELQSSQSPSVSSFPPSSLFVFLSIASSIASSSSSSQVWWGTFGA